VDNKTAANNAKANINGLIPSLNLFIM